LLPLFAIVTAVAIFLAYALWIRTRRHQVNFTIPPETELPALMHTLAGLTWSRVVEGNSVEIVQNSGFFDALLDDVGKARSHVHFETFLWQNGSVSDRMVDVLTAKAREGVEVRVLVDQRGAITTSPRVWAALREGGCDFRVYHRARLRELAWYNNRDHRKIAVIDADIAWTFGHGIADMWGPSADQPAGWRDTAGRFRGPVVNELQSAFLENWMKVTRNALAGERYFPAQKRAGSIAMHVAYVAPPETISAVKRLYYLAIAAAKREVILQNPYFIPDRHAIALCARAVARGVDVKLMLPTSDTSDFPVVQHASHRYYGPLLQSGARIWEYRRSGMHQKVMVVDREWCTVGSTNFDPRSFNINDEITVAIYDAGIAGELSAAFEADVKDAEEWTLERWNARSLRHRLTDRASALLKRQL
jgi:cardiolipin synthase